MQDVIVIDNRRCRWLFALPLAFDLGTYRPSIIANKFIFKKSPKFVLAKLNDSTVVNNRIAQRTYEIQQVIHNHKDLRMFNYNRSRQSHDIQILSLVGA